MCNALNHPSGCTCGWGGVGHSGVRGTGTYTKNSRGDCSAVVPPIRQVMESYVNPNARCPVCGSPVFFYEFSYGGRVFFDELGPPWLKHPCTDTVPKALYSTHAQSADSPTKAYEWQRNGWSPIFESSISTRDRGITQVVGFNSGRRVTFYLNTHQKAALYGSRMNAVEALVFLRKDENAHFFISLYLSQGVEGSFRAFEHLSEARRFDENTHSIMKDGPRCSDKLSEKQLRYRASAITAANMRNYYHLRDVGRNLGLSESECNEVERACLDSKQYEGIHANARDERSIRSDPGCPERLTEKQLRYRASVIMATNMRNFYHLRDIGRNLGLSDVECEEVEHRYAKEVRSTTTQSDTKNHHTEASANNNTLHLPLNFKKSSILSVSTQTVAEQHLGREMQDESGESEENDEYSSHIIMLAASWYIIANEIKAAERILNFMRGMKYPRRVELPPDLVLLVEQADTDAAINGEV